METANQLLAEIQKVKAGRAAGGRPQPTGRLPRPVTQIETTPSQPGYMSPPPEAQLDGLRTSVDNMRLGGVDQQQLQQQQAPQQQLDYYGRQTPVQPGQDQFGQHYVTQPLPPGNLNYYQPEGPAPQMPQIPPGALPPGARVPAPMPYAEPPIHPASGRQSYERPGPPPQQDPYGYQVCCALCSRVLRD